MYKRIRKQQINYPSISKGREVEELPDFTLSDNAFDFDESDNLILEQPLNNCLHVSSERNRRSLETIYSDTVSTSTNVSETTLKHFSNSAKDIVESPWKHKFIHPKSKRQLQTSPISTGRSGNSTIISTTGNYAKELPNNYIVSLVEFHNRQQVGVAAIDVSNSKVVLSQYSDNHMYTNTLSLLNCFEPNIILMSDTATDSILYHLVRHEFQLAQMNGIKRKYFNESVGLEYIERLCIKEKVDALDLQASKYLCISACACLLKFLEFHREMTYAPYSLSISMHNIDGFMQLDMSTVTSLELVNVQQVGQGATRTSLFDILNHTKTRSGSKLLRTTILQPLNNISVLKLRLDAVSSLISDESLFFRVRSLLEFLGEIDTICSSLVFIPRKMSLSVAQQQITNMMSLRTILLHLQDLTEILDPVKDELLHSIASTLISPSLEAIQQAIASVINEEVVLNRNNAEQMRTQIVYAIQSGIDSMLDVARETYCEALEGLYAEAAKIFNDFNITGGKLHYTSSRGYHLVVPTSLLPPDRFQNVIHSRVYKGTKVYCTTNSIQSLDTRQQEAFHDTCFFTSKLTGELVASVRSHSGWLYSVNDAISLLDLLASFATHITLNMGYTRPQFTADGPLAIKQGRHPMLDLQKKPNTPAYVANDCYITELSNVMIVTGPNNSGKSTYIRQVALLAIMAHIGCYIPAQVATFRVTDQIFTCLASSIGASNTISIESDRSTSSFFTEMRDMSRILDNVKPRSLVILDEVGRSTSNVDGVAIAWTLCEELAKKRTLCLFATHFLELTELPKIYPMIKNICLEVEYNNNSPESLEPKNPSALRYNYKVASGSTSEKSSFYGIAVAQAAAFPTSLTSDAYTLAKRLKEGRVASVSDISLLKSSALHTLVARLLALPASADACQSLSETRQLLIDISVNFANEVQKIQQIVLEESPPSTTDDDLEANNNQ